MNNEQLLRLVELMHEGILTQSGWEAMLRNLAQVTGSQAASLVLWDRNSDGAFVGDQSGLPAEMVAEYAQSFH